MPIHTMHQMYEIQSNLTACKPIHRVTGYEIHTGLASNCDIYTREYWHRTNIYT